MRAQPQPDMMICDQCLETLPETQMVPVDDFLLVCRKCWRELRRSDKRKERRER